MSLKQFLLSRTFRINFIISVCILIFILIFTFWSLKIYTRHGQENTVPGFEGLTFEQAKQTARDHHLRVRIIDSIYQEGALPGRIIKQVPEPGFKVKKNRTILFTINSSAPENVVVPKLTDISFRQAQALIENCGLVLGTITYKPSEFDNLVLGAYSGSIEVLPGDKLAKGTILDIVVGKTAGNYQTPLPDLTGLTIQEATEILNSSLLNVGAVIYDETVVSGEDTLNIMIYKQLPDPKLVPNVELGSSVDIWVTTDSLKLIKDEFPEIR